MAKKSKPSKIMLDEQFAGEDNDFLQCLKQFEDYQLLLNFTQRWLADQRPDDLLARFGPVFLSILAEWRR